MHRKQLGKIYAKQIISFVLKASVRPRRPQHWMYVMKRV